MYIDLSMDKYRINSFVQKNVLQKIVKILSCYGAYCEKKKKKKTAKKYPTHPCMCVLARLLNISLLYIKQNP